MKVCPRCGATGINPCRTASGALAKQPHTGRVATAEPHRMREAVVANIKASQAKATRATDGRNRAARTFIQGALYAVGLAAVLVVTPVLTTSRGWADVDWRQIGFSLAQSVGMALLAYLGRTVLDPSKVPSLAPPAPPAAAGD